MPTRQGGSFLKNASTYRRFRLATDDDIAMPVDAMNLKDGFCDIEADRRDCRHDELLRILVASSATDSKALARPVGGAVHSITSGPHPTFAALRRDEEGSHVTRVGNAC